MFFSIKKNKIIINAFIASSYNHVNELTPVKLSKDFIPAWWKQLPKSSFSLSNIENSYLTVRHCPGIINSFTTGFIIPMWSDFSFTWDNDNYKYQFADGVSLLQLHDDSQAKDFYKNEWKTKLHSPWFFEVEKHEIQILLQYPFWLNPTRPPFVFPSGINETKENKFTSNFFMFFPKQSPGEVLIKHGTPICQFIPLTEKEIIIKTHVIDDSEFNKKQILHHPNINFVNKFFKQCRLNKKI